MGYLEDDLVRLINVTKNITMNDYNNDIDLTTEHCKDLSLLELGEQELMLSPSTYKVSILKSFMENRPRKFKTSNYYYSKDYLQTIFKKVVSVDYMVCCKDTVKVDLSKSLKSQGINDTYDVITNYGTSEHVGEFDEHKHNKINHQYIVFKSIHDALNKEGLMIHAVPCKWIRHGVYHYEPEFFENLAKACGYKVLYLSLIHI